MRRVTSRLPGIRSMRLTNRLVFAAASLLILAALPVATPAEPYFTEEELEANPNLTPNLRKLIMAYENYLELYPNGERAKHFLLDEAGRFRDVGDNTTAVDVLQRVLRRTDLEQSDRSYAYEQIMDSYQTIGEFARQEEWAHRMASADVGPAKQQQAKDFIFQAGYNRAKAEEDAENYPEAARAYERLSVRNPDHSQAPNAMLKAAGMWESAEDMNRAALTYERFYYTYPDYRDPATGKGALVALETAAAIYAAHEDYRHTADAVERILAAAPDHPDHMKYLNNLASIYALLKDYNNAIRVRQDFIAAYPQDPKSGSYLWDIAEYRGIVGQSRQQLAEYESFIRSYPSDWRAVEANYRIAVNRMASREDAYEDGRPDEATRFLALARGNFERAFSLHDSLAGASGGDGGDLQHAVKSLVYVAQMDSSNYYDISLVGSQNFTQDSTLKWQTLQTSSKTYLKLANYGYPPATFAALFKRGRMFEDFAYEYLRQPRPDTAVTYGQILATFSINAVSQAILRSAAMPAFQAQMLDFYEQHKADIDTAAAEVEDIGLREVHLTWLDRARERLESIPAVVDSLELNTIQYEADLLVLDAQQKIPERFETAWTRFAEDHRARYEQTPYAAYADKQTVFDLGVSPIVYGQLLDTVMAGVDTTIRDPDAMVPRFMDIIQKGEPLGEDWQTYNQGRLRLVFAARSNYYKQVGEDAVAAGLRPQVQTLYRQSQSLFETIEGLPTLDLSALGDPPTRPDLSTPPTPERPPGAPAEWTNEQKLGFVNEYKAYQQAVANLRTRIARFRTRTERYRERRTALIERQTEAFRGVLEEARAEAQIFASVTRETQIYRMAIERVVGKAADALARDIAFGDSVSYSEAEMYSVRDSALAYGYESAREMDSLYVDILGLRDQYTAKRDTGTGGEGTPAFSVANNLVTGYAAVADSFRSAAIRRYLFLFDGRDSLFAAGLEHPTVARAVARLKQLDPTFGVTTVPMTFTFVSEDSTGLWRASSFTDKNNPDAWRDREFNDSTWVPAVRGNMSWYFAHDDPPATPATEPRTEPAQESSAYDTTGQGLAGAPGDTLASAGTDTTGLATADTLAQDARSAPDAFADEAPAQQAFQPIAGFPEQGNLNLTDIWTPEPADTVYLRRSLQLPPRWDEAPDSLRTPESPKPVIRSASITASADDDYRVYVNGQVTNARDQAGGVDWGNAKTAAVLKDQWFVGDTANVIAINARNELRTQRIPDTDTTTYGMIMRLDVEMDVPYGIYEALYKPPEPEPEFVLELAPNDSSILADTTGQYFYTQTQRESWLECRSRELRAVWEDSILVPWRIARAEEQMASTDSSMARTQRWLVQQKRDAQLRLAQAAGAAVGAEFDSPMDGGGEESGYDGGYDGSQDGDDGYDSPSDGASGATDGDGYGDGGGGNPPE